jgi:hypothetical protein
MKGMLVILLSLFSGPSLAGELFLGKNEVAITSRNGKEVLIRVEITEPAKEGCANWRWGAEGNCPKRAIAGLEALVDGQEIFVPRSAFADLGSPRTVSVTPTRSGFELNIDGGDAGASYTAILEFRGCLLRSRRVEGKSFADSAWEKTRFSFPD